MRQKRSRPWSGLGGYLRDAKVATWRKALGIASVVYLVWPFDVVPDVLPIVGWMDDLGILTAGALWMARELKRHRADNLL